MIVKINNFIKSNEKIIIIAVIIVAIFLRFYKIDSIPPSASLDEASITYNAYSVLKTGSDEFGEFPLISQRGYDDWRRSSYLLLEIPFVSIFDLSTYSARLPAAILSIFTVIALYIIVKKIFIKSDFSYFLSSISALFLAISPWHVYISRLGHESNASLSSIIIAIAFFFVGLKKKYLLFFSGIFFLIGMVSYYTGQIVVPIIVATLVVLYRKELRNIIFSNKISIVLSVLVLLLACLAAWSVFSPDAMVRYKGTNIFNPEVHGKAFKETVDNRLEAINSGNIIGIILNDRRVFYLKSWVENYVSHFRTDWLYFNYGDIRFKAPDLGLLYLWQFPLSIVGLVFLAKLKDLDRRVKIFLVIWFLVGPLPASIATQAPHAMRAYNILPLWQILSALGVIGLIGYMSKNKRIEHGIMIVFVIILISSFYKIYQSYFLKFPKQNSVPFQTAYALSIPYILENQHKYDKVVISNKENLFQSYMIFLYHSKFDPVIYKKLGGTISAGYNATHKFDKYEFRPIDWKNEPGGKILYVGNPNEIPDNRNVLFKGLYTDNKLGVIISTK